MNLWPLVGILRASRSILCLRRRGDKDAMRNAGIVKLWGMIVSPGNSRHFADGLSADPTLRPPAPYPCSRPNARSGSSALRGTPTRPANAAESESVEQEDLNVALTKPKSPCEPHKIRLTRHQAAARACRSSSL